MGKKEEMGFSGEGKGKGLHHNNLLLFNKAFKVVRALLLLSACGRLYTSPERKQASVTPHQQEQDKQEQVDNGGQSDGLLTNAGLRSDQTPLCVVRCGTVRCSRAEPILD
ncbi:hypothetical protein PoB_005487600 [Plakobranchus ocellatus]|uniref:Lipoprotein n=1 Tax=Plakobranchus ocellatus TaxID=259542 RepID=A0AAV4C6N8_9GAST|nr:hypothetical protein PoB_005487600 [Plakobranchus ocellatus]